MDPIDLVVLVSGTGSNLKAIVQAIDEHRCHARVRAVISDQANSAAIAWAKERKIPTDVVPLKRGADRQQWNQTLAARVVAYQPDLVVLAGFMRVIGPALLEALPSKIINIHPSLLPAFPGAHGAADALAAGVQITGCTVHVVDTSLDGGPILAQTQVPILPNDTVISLHERIKVQEHQLLPAVIDAIARGNLTLSSSSTWVADTNG